jgi:hypothetical protein
LQASDESSQQSISSPLQNARLLTIVLFLREAIAGEQLDADLLLLNAFISIPTRWLARLESNQQASGNSVLMVFRGRDWSVLRTHKTG